MAYDFQRYLDLTRQFDLGSLPPPRLDYQPVPTRGPGTATAAPLWQTQVYDFQRYLDLARQFGLGSLPPPRLDYRPVATRGPGTATVAPLWQTLTRAPAPQTAVAAGASTTGSAPIAVLPVGTTLPDGGVVVESARNPFGSYMVVDYGQDKRLVGSNVARTAAQARPGSALWRVFYDEQGNPVRNVLERVKRARQIGFLTFTPGQKRGLDRLRGRI